MKEQYVMATAFTCYPSLLYLYNYFQNVTRRMRSKPEIQFDVGSAGTELCTKREQKEVSFTDYSTGQN